MKDGLIITVAGPAGSGKSAAITAIEDLFKGFCDVTVSPDDGYHKRTPLEALSILHRTKPAILIQELQMNRRKRLLPKLLKGGTVVFTIPQAKPCECGSPTPTDAFGEKGKCDECKR